MAESTSADKQSMTNADQLALLLVRAEYDRARSQTLTKRLASLAQRLVSAEARKAQGERSRDRGRNVRDLGDERRGRERGTLDNAWRKVLRFVRTVFRRGSTDEAIASSVDPRQSLGRAAHQQPMSVRDVGRQRQAGDGTAPSDSVQRIVGVIGSLPREQREAVAAAVLKLVNTHPEYGRLYHDSPGSMPQTKILVDAARKQEREIRWQRPSLKSPDFNEWPDFNDPDRFHGTGAALSSGSQNDTLPDDRAVLADGEGRRSQASVSGTSAQSVIAAHAYANSESSVPSSAFTESPFSTGIVTRLSPTPGSRPPAPQGSATSSQRGNPVPKATKSR